MSSCHSVEISWFFYYSDFTWNQFWGFLKCKISHFTTFRSSEFSLLWNFAFFEVWNLDQMNKIPSHFDHLSTSEFWIFGHYWHFLLWISPKMKNSKPPKWSKWQFLTFRSQSKLIPRKMEFAGKLLNFHTVAHSLLSVLLKNGMVPPNFSIFFELPLWSSWSQYKH